MVRVVRARVPPGPTGTVRRVPLTVDTVARRTVDVGATLSWFRHGVGDPTTRLTRHGAGTGAFARATFTPDGPATVLVRWGGRRPVAEAWGPGAEWMLGRVPAMTGADDDGAPELRRAPDPAVRRAARDRRGDRLGASGDLYHELLPTIIGQRITSGEARRQWRRLCRELGTPAPGPIADLLLPPAPRELAGRPTWWFHPLGIERKRAQALITVARHADHLWRWAALGAGAAGPLLGRLRGVGLWTVGSVLGPALGDADAVPVGDYHLKHLVAWALAGEPRATDERMLELLAPYGGQRGRVARLLKLTVGGAPSFGPRQRIQPMHTW